ncbi:unnamed protein product [Mytilus edulis]|uniref:Uncharacterized protein n=1 Tax=Mytilus edulis TaxID=6550 RepID=A0A8S3VJ30_MYTED|nr:unnamed protein product [Mytilus edulis]
MTAIGYANYFTSVYNLTTYLGAWMPQANANGDLNQTEIVNFGKYFAQVIKPIPWSMNVLDTYYDTKNNNWKLDEQAIKGQTLNMSRVLDEIISQIDLKEIRKLTENAGWNYCPTDDNPTDYLTRRIYAKHLYNNRLWMNGPQWILNRENWPTWTRKIEDCSTMVTVSDDNTDDEITNASTCSTQTISCIDIL